MSKNTYTYCIIPHKMGVDTRESYKGGPAMRQVSMQTERDILVFLSWCDKERTQPKFKGYFPLGVLLRHGRILPDYTTIRIMESGYPDIGYYVDEEGFLREVGVPNAPPLNAMVVLSEENCPHGWEPEQLRRAE